MFGHVVAVRDDLSEAELSRYSSVYCGLCRTLGQDFGQLARLGLTFDMTFLALLLSSLYEPAESPHTARCIAHPMKQHTSTHSDAVRYAAAMTIALTYYKALDDWNDERKVSRRLYAGHLKSRYREVQTAWPRQCAAIEDGMERIDAAEQSASSPEPALQAFGSLLGELFVWREDPWSRPLRQFGMYLGQFIYLLDAAVDYDSDLRSGNWNPLLLLRKQPEEMLETLEILIGQATAVFELLPLEQDLQLMRNILYAGVWQRYNGAMQKRKKEEEQHG